MAPVLSLFVLGASSVTVPVPLALPFSETLLISYPYRTTQRAPLGTVTDTPELTVIGPTDIAFLLDVKV